MQVKNRDSVDLLFTWDLSDIYKDENAFNEELEAVKLEIEKISEIKDRMMNNASELKSALDFYYSLERRIGKLYIYAMLYKSEDNGNPKAQALEGKAVNLYVDFGSKSSFIEPVILSEKEKLISFLKSEELKSYKRVLSEMLRRSEHILSEKEEEILAKLSDVARASKNAFEMLESVDMTFPETLGENGEQVHGLLP